MTRALIVLLAVGALCLPVQATAQVTTLAAKVCGPYVIKTGQKEPGGLTKDYTSGDWEKLQRRARTIISQAGEAWPCGDDLEKLLDDTVNFVAITWVGFDPVKEKPQLMRAVVHQPPTRPFTVDLPGIGTKPDDPVLVELFVSRGTDANLATMYTSTREENATVAQLPAFAQTIVGPLFGTVGAIAGTVPARGRAVDCEKDPTQCFAVTVYRVGLPMRRASIRLRANARDLVDADSFGGALSSLATTVMFKQAARSECARDYADSLARGLADLRAHDRACQGTAIDPRDCARAFDTFFRTQYASSLPACGNSKDDVEALQNVDKAFRDLVSTYATATAELDTTFHNRPLTHFSFGAGGAVIAFASKPLHGRTRVALDDNGNLKADPLPRVMTLAYVNWSPRGYDEEAEPMQRTERWRWFFGAALTPDFGPVGGGTVTVVRGLGVTVGGGLLFGKGADPGAVDHPPTSETDQFKLAAVPVFFAGVSYVFK